MDCPFIGEAGQTYIGTGDLLCAMLLANIEKNPDDFAKAVELAVNTLRAVLHKTVKEPIPGTKEISLIASKDLIENPPFEIKI
jgi:pyridoxal/pyridoxine/pyridoxamine kinase